MERTSVIFPAIPLQGSHKRAESPALSPRYFPVARAEFTICCFFRRIVLGIPVEPEVWTSTKGASEAQARRKSPINLSWAFVDRRDWPKGIRSFRAREWPSRLKSGCILCQVGCSIAQGHKFFLGQYLAKKALFPVPPTVFLRKYQYQYGVDHQYRDKDIPTQAGLGNVLIDGIGMEGGPVRGHQKGRDQIVGGMEAQGQLQTLVHQGDEPQKEAGAYIIDQDAISQLPHLGVAKVHQPEDHRGQQQGQPTVFGQEAEALHQLSPQKIFLKTGLERHQQDGDDGQGDEFHQVEVPDKILRVQKNVQPGDQQGEQAPKR